MKLLLDLGDASLASDGVVFFEVARSFALGFPKRKSRDPVIFTREGHAYLAHWTTQRSVSVSRDSGPRS